MPNVNRDFLYGALVGVVGVWAFHRFVKPMNTSMAAAKRSGLQAA